jgi:hypothetical protein
MNRKWLTLGLAFASGVAMGVAASWTHLEAKANEKYRTWIEMRIGTEDQLRQLQQNRAVPPVPQLREDLKADLSEYVATVKPYSPPVGNTEFEIINEDIYNSLGSEFDKITLEIFHDDLQYVLVMDGETVLDWKDILTPVIIEELKGQEGLYLRNNKKGEDYHVTWGQP